MPQRYGLVDDIVGHGAACTSFGGATGAKYYYTGNNQYSKQNKFFHFLKFYSKFPFAIAKIRMFR